MINPPFGYSNTTNSGGRTSNVQHSAKYADVETLPKVTETPCNTLSLCSSSHTTYILNRIPMSSSCLLDRRPQSVLASSAVFSRQVANPSDLFNK